MKKTFLSLCLAILSGAALPAQPSFTAPPPSKAVVPGADTRREAYDQRIDEALAWRRGLVNLAKPTTLDPAAIAAKLVRHEDVAACSARVIELMKEGGSGPF